MATISRRLAGPSYLPHLRREDGDDERGGLPYPFSGSASTGGDPRAFPRSPSPGIPLTWLSEADTMLVCAPMFDWGDWDWGDRNDPNDLGGSGNVLPLLDPETDADQREAGP